MSRAAAAGCGDVATRPAPGHLVDVIEFEQGARRAALAGLADERALAAISLPHRALDVRRDVPRARGRSTLALGPRGRGELALLELANQRVQRPIEHGRDIARGDLVAEELLSVPQLVVRALIDGDLERQSLRGQRFHAGSRVVNTPRGVLRGGCLGSSLGG